MPLALTFVEVTEYWTSAKASVQYSVTSTKVQASDKIYDCCFSIINIIFIPKYYSMITT